MANNKIDTTIEICGSSGDGSIAAGQILNLAMTVIGFHVINFDSYPAEIRGFGRSVAHTRVSDQPLFTTGKQVDCLVALNDKHSISRIASLRNNGVIVYDSTPMDFVEEEQAIAGNFEPGMVGYGVPLRELSIQAVQSSKSRNIVALGALAGLFEIPANAFHEAIQKRFAGKKKQISDTNIKAFDLGFSFAQERLEKADQISFGNTILSHSDDVMVISGNEMTAKACVDAGVTLFAGYPITPATRIMELLARDLPAHGGVVVQTEDEISAIGHIIGGGFSGRRCATATSGPGLCLMVEMLNLAVMTEIPIVVIDSQRAGPSTGLPTKTEQADLNLAIFGGSGDSPRPVLAPANVRECYELVFKAFELAEAFQTPVLVLLDFFLSNRMEDVDGKLIDPDRFGTYEQLLAKADSQPYQRYTITDTGISPRALPGMDNLYYTATGLEHDQRGFPDYSPENHKQMTDKRQNKITALKEAWPDPEVIGSEGELDIGLISWGSSIGSAMEALDILSEKGIKAGGLFPRLMWPVNNEAVVAFSDRCRVLAVAEMNGSGQYGGIIAQSVERKVIRLHDVYSAPFPAVDIVERLETILS